jgi:hypothetical protein
MKTVLLVWELGGGLGHVMALRRLARRLRSLNLRIVAAVKNLEAGRPLSSEGIEIIQAPVWPSASMPPRQIAATSSASMGDILATAGLRDRTGLRQLLHGWDDISLRLQPDLVVCHLAPAAALAGRGKIPLVMVGDGFTLPPDQTQRFPRLHAMTEPEDEAVTLDILNGVLHSLGKRTLDRLPQMFSGDARLVLTFALLDPYPAHRSEPLLGPLFDQTPVAAIPQKQAIFAYLSPGYPVHRDIAGALLAHAPSLQIYAPDLPEQHAKDLERAGAVVHRNLATPADALRSAALVIHFGGSGLAAEALAAGVPQLVLSMQVEQWLNGSALQNAGVGKVIAAFDPDTRITSEIDDLLSDTLMPRVAAQAGRFHRQLLSATDPLAVFENTCRRLLAV